MGRGVAAGALVLLYLTLSYSALTCALHHGLYGECPHHGGGHHQMAAAGHGMAGMPGEAPMPGDTAPHAGMGLCHCLDNLAAEPPAPLMAVAAVPPVAETVPVPAALPSPPPAGPARPRAPPAFLA
jgi:hypothetical protein